MIFRDQWVNKLNWDKNHLLKTRFFYWATDEDEKFYILLPALLTPSNNVKLNQLNVH